MRVGLLSRSSKRLLAKGAILFLAGLASTISSATPSIANDLSVTNKAKTIGLVLSVWDSAILETPDAQECPEGLQFSEMDQWLAMSEPERVKQNKRFGLRRNRGTNG